MTRAEKVALIRATQAAHPAETGARIAARLGMKHTTLRNLLSDPDGSKQLARRARYKKPCPRCSTLMDGSGGYKGQPRLCATCAALENHENRYWTRERCVAAGRAWAARYGRRPQVSDWIRSGTRPEHPAFSTIYQSHSDYAAPFDSWRAFVLACGFECPPRGEYVRSGEVGLGRNERAALTYLRAHGGRVKKRAIVAALFADRPVALSPDANTWQALRSLRARGLVEMVGHGWWQAIDAPELEVAA